MSRRLVIIILAVLIIGIVGGTVALVLSRLRPSRPADSTITTPTDGLQEAQTGSQNIIDPNGDRDGDGLSNADEAIWGTDNNKSDTDGDGFLDGEEVKANHNPTIAAPNDVLPAGFRPGQDINPLQVAQSGPLAVDQFFTASIDIPDKDLTAEYKKKYPTDQQSSETLFSFVKEQPIVTQLPKPANKSINIQSENTAIGLAVYLNELGNLASISNKTLLASSLRSLFQDKDPAGFIDLSRSAKRLQEKLVAGSAPPAAEPVHRLLLGYTELLSVTFDQITEYNTDQVGALVALRQLEENDKIYFPLIQQEIDKLRALQQQLAGN